MKGCGGKCKCKKISLENFVDVAGGKMSFDQVRNNIINYLLEGPERLIADVKALPDGYQVAIYIPIKDFERRKK